MSWQTISVADLKDRKVAALVEALQESALGTGQTDPVPAIISSVIAEIRANIASCATNVLDADATKIPGDLVDLACRMVLRVAKGRLEIELTQDERDDRRDDARRLERIAACDLKIEATDNPEATASIAMATATPLMNEVTRNFTRTQQNGI